MLLDYLPCKHAGKQSDSCQQHKPQSFIRIVRPISLLQAKLRAKSEATMPLNKSTLDEIFDVSHSWTLTETVRFQLAFTALLHQLHIQAKLTHLAIRTVSLSPKEIKRTSLQSCNKYFTEFLVHFANLLSTTKPNGIETLAKLRNNRITTRDQLSSNAIKNYTQC